MGVGADTSAKALQEAIWFLENEPGGVANDYVTTAKKMVANGIWPGLGDVRVMNLGRAQDQLTVAPVPELPPCCCSAPVSPDWLALLAGARTSDFLYPSAGHKASLRTCLF